MKMEYTQYLNSQENFRDKWNEYFSLPPNFSSANYVDELAPLSNEKLFQNLSESEKKRFFLEYLKLVAEALIFFEQLLVFGVRKSLNPKNNIDPQTKRALKHFAFEELYHSNGFRHFLFIHKEFNWEKNKIYADAKLLRKIISMIINFSPACVFLPGAKLEAFTLSYHRMIKKYYSDLRGNSWIHLNHIHQIDEAYHLPLEFELHDATIENMGVIRTWIGSILFVITMQIALAIGSYKVVNFSFPNFGFFKKIRFTLKMAKWAVRVTPAYKDARAITEKQFKLKKPKFGKYWSFIYW
jgi:hypothetical protein